MSNEGLEKTTQRMQRALDRERQRRRQAEDLLEVKSRELFHANEEIRSQFKELQQTQSQLLQSEKMASVGQLAAGVAHEINNPMGFILSNIRSLDDYIKSIKELLTGYDKVFADTADKSFSAITSKLKQQYDIDFIMEDIEDIVSDSLEGGDRVINIVQSLRDYSRVDSDEYTEVDINECLQTTLKLVNNETKYKCEVVTDFHDIPLLKCNAGKLNQVFTNLLVNAAHAIEEQGQITVKTQDYEKQIGIEIEDTGKGIAQADLNKIFDPFFTTKPVGEGTGLGLSISHGIIEEHNGRITVDSEPGKGTSFKIFLPKNINQSAVHH